MIKEKLVEVRGYIATGWCKGMYMVDRNGKHTIDKSKAAQWCLSGAIQMVTNDTVLQRDIEKAMDKTLSTHYDYAGGILNFNDGTSQEAVLAMLDRTIEDLQ